MSFAKLLEDLEALSADPLAKAQKPGNDDDEDERIRASADQDEDDEDDENNNGPEGDDEADEDNDEPMGKSYRVTLEDGSEVDAIDGTALIKSLTERMNSTEGALLKALNLMADQARQQQSVLVEQGKLIKSLHREVKRLGGEGKGRKSAVTVHDKTAAPLAKSEPQGLNGRQFLLKAESAMTKGAISGLDLSLCEAWVNRGMPDDGITESLAQRVMDA